MRNYNTYLLELRKEAGLSLKEASKRIGMSRLKLYFFENGYFRPKPKDLKKLNDFYQIDLSLVGEDAYPAPNKEKAITQRRVKLKGKRIAFGVLSLLSLAMVSVGAALFSQSVNNKSSYYGDTYNEMKEKVIENGEYGYDLVTSLKYYYVNYEEFNSEANIIFYQTDNILYFNECTFSKTFSNGTYGIDRYHYQLGYSLGVNSYHGHFTFGSVITGSYFSCDFNYNGEQVTSIDNFKVLIEGTETIDEETAIAKVNTYISSVDIYLTKLLSQYLERDVDFYEDFLPAREKGRVINFALQISGLILLFSGIIAFFIFFAIFIKAMVQNIKPRLVSTEPEASDIKREQLPEDWHFDFGIPDVIIVLIAKIMQYGSMVLLFIAFLAKLGIPFFSIFTDPNFLMVFKWSWLGGIFLEHFVMIGRIKKPTTLFKEIIFNTGMFLFIATIETVAISLTNAWGYDLAPLIYKYVPGNVYQVIAIHYLIFLFLFFQPSFLNKKGKVARTIWHSLSLIPLLVLVLAYIISNRYAMVYGVKENIYINFWFPNAFLSLTVVSILFIYITFFLRLYYEKKYGQHRSQVFFYGDRYTIIENIICSALIIIAASLDFIFLNNQHAYYLGLGGNYWMYVLVPFILLCKYSPNNQQIFLVDEEFSRLVSEEKEVTSN